MERCIIKIAGRGDETRLGYANSQRLGFNVSIGGNMATQSFNLEIPHTILRLGVTIVQDLVVSGLSNDVNLDQIGEMLSRDYPEAKRTAKALLRIVRDEDIALFNQRLAILRLSVSPDDTLRMKTTYARGICQILKYDKQ